MDGKINLVATKVIHLGDQLDNVNGPRARVVEAHRLMTHLSEFLSLGPLTSQLFSDPFRVRIFKKIYKLIVINIIIYRLMKRQILFKNCILYLKIYLHQSKLKITFRNLFINFNFIIDLILH